MIAMTVPCPLRGVLIASAAVGLISCDHRPSAPAKDFSHEIEVAAKGNDTPSNDPKYPPFAASQALREAGADVVPSIIEGLSSPNPEIRRYCSGFLLNVRFRKKDNVQDRLKKEAIPALSNIVTHERGKGSDNALMVLMSLNAPTARPALEAAAADTHRDDRSVAVQAIANYKDPADFDRFVKLVSDPDSKVRAVADVVLAQTGGPKALDALARRQSDVAKALGSTKDAAQVGDLKKEQGVLDLFVKYLRAGGPQSGKPLPPTTAFAAPTAPMGR